MSDMEIDKLASYDFITQVYNEVTPETLYSIGKELEDKSNLFVGYLSKERIETLSYDEIKQIVKLVFSVKKPSKKWNEEEYLTLRDIIFTLLHSDEDLKLRFNNFCDVMISKYKIDKPYSFTSELLHFYDPDKYWLWTNWMFDPKSNTGSLLLLLEEGVELDDVTRGNQYMNIGKAVKSLEVTASQIGIREPNVPPTSKFETSVFLCAVFAVYMYTVTRMRMTKEFNTILPRMTELIYRLFGIYRGKKEEKEVIENES